MLTIALTLIMGFGLGRIGGTLTKEHRRKKRLNDLVGRTAKEARRTKKNVAHAETVEQPASPAAVFRPIEGEVPMNKDDIKEKIHEFFENCESPVMPFHVAKEIGLDEEFTKSMLDEFVCSGELQQDGGLYGRRMEASTEHAAEETVH